MDKEIIKVEKVCPKCDAPQKVVPNPYYLHICSKCGWRGDYRKLLSMRFIYSLTKIEKA